MRIKDMDDKAPEVVPLEDQAADVQYKCDNQRTGCINIINFFCSTLF